MPYLIKNVDLAPAGRQRTAWAAREMPVVGSLRKNYSRTKPFQGLRISCCLHITSETANLVIALKEAGAEVALAASNPLSTQDEVAAHLVRDHSISVFGLKGENERTYYTGIRALIERQPHLLVDDGADLIATVHRYKSLAGQILGATEETTTGVIRLTNLAQKKLLLFPVVAVNNADTKHLFDNRYGTGQSTVDGLLRATNILLAGKVAVICGYGWCGRGIAMRLKGMGARVIVTEVNPLRALEAVMDGYAVMPVKAAATVADLFITATGNTTVLSWETIRLMKDGAILANAGHFNVEIDLATLSKKALQKTRVRPYLDEYLLPGKRRVFVLGEGRLVNLACAEGHPAAVMDMSFANQFLSLKFLKENHPLSARVYPVPPEIDQAVATLKLKSMGVQVDRLSHIQKEYLHSWHLGT
ncbi:MAG TPA: adenosylhomocysteinase [bacterium]|nr:adenosylhomocysteinase [bacterium]